jgi:endoglucanase
MTSTRQRQRRRRAIGTTAALVLVTLGIAALLRISDPDAIDRTEVVGSSSVDNARVAATDFLSTYLQDDGRVARVDQGGDTVSEGQAYALLLAAGIGDRARFDRAWTWTREHLQRADGLLAWRWQNGEVVDDKPATDADLDATRALLVAADRFDEPHYRREALRIADTILARETVEVRGRAVLVAGPWARMKAPFVVNPSYFSPRSFIMLARATGDDRWIELADTSREIVAKLTQRAELVPDWTVVTKSNEVYATSAPGVQGSPTYSYDAQRTYIRFAEDCDPRGRQLAGTAWDFAQRERRDTIEPTYTLQGDPAGDGESASGVVALAAVASGSGQDMTVDDLLARADAVDGRHPTYYGSAWIALGRMTLTTSLLGDCL